MSYTEALARVAQIQSEIAALTQPEAQPSTGNSSSSSPSFAQTLAKAQEPAPSASAVPASALATPTSTLAPFETPPSSADVTAPAAGYSAEPTGTAGSYYPTAFLPGSYEASTTPASRSQSPLSASQQEFAARLAADTGLDPQVVSAWLLAEESGGAATARESEGNNDWLNIGYTDSGTYGAGAAVWSNPLTAADATAGWLAGQNTISGYGTASAPIQAILHSAGQAPEAQIAAIQQSGWASSGYPDLPALFQQVAG